MESDACSCQGCSRRAQTQPDISDPSTRGYVQRPRPKSVHDLTEISQDLRSMTASQVSAREHHPTGSSSSARHSSSRRHQHHHHQNGRRESYDDDNQDMDGETTTRDFLRQFGAIDLAHASQLWASDKQRLSHLESIGTTCVTPARAFLSRFGARDFHEAATLWMGERDKLDQADAKFHRLQNEILTMVDRFQPTYDETISDKFRMLQAAIGVFVNQSLTKSVRLDPWNKWEGFVLWEGAANPSKVAGGGTGGLPKREEKLLVRQAVWKFLAEALFERARPFASFGGAAGELAGRWVFDALFPDHERSEDAAKWRSLTVKQLSARADDEQGRRQARKELAEAFAAHVLDNMTSLSHTEIAQSSATKKLASSDKLDDVLKQAIALSRLVMGERASFSLRAPPLQDMKFKRDTMDKSTTIVGSEVNMVFNEEEDEKAGVVKLFASPMLVKYGNTGGQDLDQETVLLRAFVILA